MDFKKLGQMGQPAASKRQIPPGTQLTAIVKVNQDDYEPAKVHVRSKMSPRIFTADFSSDDFAAIESDSKVEAVSLAEKLPLQKSP